MAQTKNCRAFKDGKFIIQDGNAEPYIIDRKGSRQIESGGPTKSVIRFNVRWQDECTYILRLDKVLENPMEIPYPEGITLKVTIIETKDNSYVQVTTSGLVDVEYQSEVIRIE